MELRHQITLIRSRLWLIVAAVLLAGGVAFLVSNALPKAYEGSVTLIVGQSLASSNPDYNQILASQRLSQTYADLATTTPIVEKVMAKYGIDSTSEEFRKRIKADAPRESTLVHLVVEDGDPQRAAALANALADEIIAASPAIAGRNSSIQRFIDDDLLATQKQIGETQAEIQRLASLTTRSPSEDQRLDVLNGRLVTLRQSYATMLAFSSNSGANLLTVVDPASPAREPTSPRVLLSTVLAGMAGLVLALGLVFLLEYLDDTIGTPEDVQALVGLPTLGLIGRIGSEKRSTDAKGPVVMVSPHSPAAEAYRTLRTNLDFASVDTSIHTLLVTSSVPGEGKTTTAANLAAVFAQAGRRTILLDADLRSPGVHSVFKLPNERGLSDLLRSEDTRLQDVVQRSDQDELFVITSGPLPPNPAELLASSRMRRVFERVAGVAALVILDSPPLLAVSDAAILASATDGTLLVVDAKRTHRSVVRNAYEALAKADARILGIVINRLPKRANTGYYYRANYSSFDGARADGGSTVPQASGGPMAQADRR